MKSKHTQKILLSDQQRKDLELIVCRRKSAQSMVLRAKIILVGAEGKSLQKTWQDLECNRETGIQAPEPVSKGKLVRPGQIEKREFEYRRQGTQALLAGMDVVTGKIIPLIRDIRAEACVLAESD